jgi:hypothetical protein
MNKINYSFWNKSSKTGYIHFLNAMVALFDQTKIVTLV